MIIDTVRRHCPLLPYLITPIRNTSIIFVTEEMFKDSPTNIVLGCLGSSGG